jgi:hypothetical protein
MDLKTFWNKVKNTKERIRLHFLRQFKWKNFF